MDSLGLAGDGKGGKSGGRVFRRFHVYGAEALRESVRGHLVSDVPLGAFLSGGVDSSAVVATMARVSGGRVRTFSIGFDRSDYDETRYARLVAQRLGTEHHEQVVKPDAVAMAPRLVWHYNEPFADSSALPSLALCEMARGFVTVALNVDGGDEAFFGYDRYLATVVAVGVVVYALANLLHEGLGHGGACLVVDCKPTFLSSLNFDGNTVGLSMAALRLIGAGGTLVNIAVGIAALAALPHIRTAPAQLRYFVWLGAIVNLFQGTGYLLFSGVAGIGDWASVIEGLSPTWAWRVGLMVTGGVSYFATMWVAMICNSTAVPVGYTHVDGSLL